MIHSGGRGGRWPAALLVAVLLAPAGCDGRGTPAPTAASSPAATPASPASAAPASAAPPSAAATGEARSGSGDAPPGSFADVVRARIPEIAVDRRDEEIQAVADTACADLAAGRSADEVVAVTRTLGTLDAEATDQATARELVKLAIDTTCPGQAGRVDEF